MSDAFDNTLDRCRHGRTAGQACDVCDDEDVDLRTAAEGGTVDLIEAEAQAEAEAEQRRRQR
jgi:hypothetical protein